MYTLGIDIGSASSKVVILEDGQDIRAGVVIPVGTGTSGPGRAMQEAFALSGLKREDISWMVATGYGRMNFPGADEQVSEITCHAQGVHLVVPGVRTIVDIGGQDAKIIKVGPEGNVLNFAMNDKCAAGTGRFLEVMARVLETDVSQLADMEKDANGSAPISSTCTVFAESEVISQLSNGVGRAELVAGIHESVARKIAGLAARVGLVPEVVMTGGVAKNLAVVKAVEKISGIPITVAPNSQLTGALGAALIAIRNYRRSRR